MEEVSTGVAEDTEVEVMVVDVDMFVVVEENVVEVSMVKTHMNFQQAQNICGRSSCISCRPM